MMYVVWEFVVVDKLVVSDFILVKMVYFWYHLCSMYILEVRFYRSGVPCRLTIIILLSFDDLEFFLSIQHRWVQFKFHLFASR